MEYISTKEAAVKWGISNTRVNILANEGRIPGVQRLGKSWLIPANATKPPKLKANHSGEARKDTDSFSFPLYHFRPDLIYIKEEQLSEQQRSLIQAEAAVMECRFADAYPLLESILQDPEDIVTEIGALWNAGLCCVGLNMPEEFSKHYLQLKLNLAKDLPHKNDLAITLDILKTYLKTITSSAKNEVFNTNIHYQALPLACLNNGYTILSKEAIKPGSTDINLLELNLLFLKNTSALVAVEMMQCYLLGIYSIRNDTVSAERHAKDIIQTAYENKYYFPLVTYYRYFTSILSSVLEQYPEDFQNHCQKLFSQYEKNFTAFSAYINESSFISNLSDKDYPYIYAILTDIPYSHIPKYVGVSESTAKRRLRSIYEKLGVKNKNELKNFLLTYM